MATARPAAVEVSVCVAVHRAHRAPNLAGLARALPAALGPRAGELVVVLNGVTAAQAGAPATASCLPFTVNRGVSVGWNAAARAATGDVLVFANDDVVLGASAIADLLDALAGLPGAGVVGVEPADGPCPADGDRIACAAVTGYLFAVRADVFSAVGGFDEAYSPCLFEEIDFCFAIKERLGLASYALGGVAADHHAGVSARRSWPWNAVRYDGRRETLWAIRRRNRRRLAQKWPGLTTS